jgi:hypothetical protein
MPLLGTAVLAVWDEVDRVIEADFDAWYLREHIPERTSVPGLLRGRRYRAETGSPRSMAFYEATTLGVLTAGPYREQLANPTDWTRRVMPHFRFMRRGLCDVAASLGDGIGGAAAVVHMTPDDEPRLREWIAGTLLPETLTMPDVVAAHLWTLAPGEPRSATTALSQDAEPERPIAWVVVVETTGLSEAEAISRAILDRDPKSHGASDVQPYPSYRLLNILDRR